LQELTTGISFEADLSSLGTLLESLIPTPPLEMRNFINECRSERTLSASSLLEHPFLYNILIPVDLQAQNDQKIASNFPPPVVQPNINLTTPINTTTHSRLDTEFEMMNYIGKGAFGDVLKVRNILDNRQYAIKRIPLSSMNKQLFKKMTREVELLSRLNHENVVRYYNSWLETQIAPIPELEDSDDDEGLSSKHKKKGLVRTHSGQNVVVLHSTDDEDSLGKIGWNAFISDSSDEDDDDWIEFEDSKGRVTKYDDDDEAQDSRSDRDGKGDGTIVQRKNTILYIQMEYCDKSTLRSAIDSGLYQDRERIQKLFREMVEGLSHIHQQGMIHRDLKCENIFLDSKDHVKIGDFGLATTNVLALQYQNNETNQSLQLPKVSYGDSHTGQVGTALYCAPELSQNACKSTYNQKVDLYSLGIIFFEMCHAPFGTGMERIQTLLQLRQPEIVIPKEMLEDGNRKSEVKIIRWLLDHIPGNRPTSEELLQSDLMPPAKVEVSEIQETFRHVLANPQSRSYKYLINRILQQESEKVISSIYHTNMIYISPVFENVKIVIEQIFRKHGAIEFTTPLLTPYNKTDPDSSVRLMSHSGLIVTLPTDLRQTFLRLVAQNAQQISYLRRYAIGRTYHERKVHNQHPKQSYECAFDIVTPMRGGTPIVDAELLTICHEIISKFESLKQRNICFRINHTSLLRAIFLYYSVPAAKYRSVLALIEEHLEEKINKKQLISSVASLIPAKNSQCVTALVDSLLVIDMPISNLSSTNLKVIIKGRGDATALAKGAVRELENVITLCQSMGVTVSLKFIYFKYLHF
jgi:eukaryotic translation initiation factor 2-alpha kinase 4